MNKLLLSIFFLSVMLVTVSSVSAAQFVYPVAGEYVSEQLVVNWTNPESTTGFYLQYVNGDCASTTGWTDLNNHTAFGGSQTTYTWNTETGSESVSDGTYCLRLQLGAETYNTSGNFTIDNTDPVANFSFSGILMVNEEVTFNATTSSDERNIAAYEWNFGDGNVSSGGTIIAHTYTGAGTYNVSLTVTDTAGNENTLSRSVVIAPIVFETETFSFEAGILNVKNLTDDSFNTGLSSVTCTFVSSGTPTNLTIASSGANCLLNWSNISYEYRGENYFSVKTTNGTNTKYFNVSVSVYTWMIDLVTGWNLISIPMMPEDTSINSVFASIIGNVSYEDANTNTIFSYQYNGSENIWYGARPYADPSSGFTYGGSVSKALTNIVPGYAYWIKMSASDTLKGVGNIQPSRGQTPSVTVMNGWNLIGHYGLELEGRNYTESLTSLVIGTTAYYDSVITDDGRMYPFEGYWMTAKFLPSGTTSYTPAQAVVNYILGIGA